ncbi:thioredoxin-like protein [Cercophora samala]|uniref:Thioredoxin-like protein n=1 Tax=Cercophora samala TaxID=330535 RepID=A0AA40DGP1_9PEZI|nr:thioredoxin-like protein [Cercophora samala]
MTVFDIKIVSDAICPWCYLGKKRLERAINLYKTSVPNASADTFKIHWHPFYLDPSLPKTSVDRDEHLLKKFGDPNRLVMSTMMLKRFGEAEGINFSLKARIGNTRDAHRLVQLAKTKSNELENSVISALFKLHFEEDGDITSHDVLIAAGEKGGLDRAEVKTWLDEGKGGPEVDKEVEEAYRDGVSGVPNFTINGKYRVEGAQDPEKLVEILKRIKASAPAVSTSSEGVTC